MKNLLLDVSIKTMIGMLPLIINSNNKSINDEFNIFYDEDKDVLKKSLIVEDGSVHAHKGTFVNIDVDTLNIKNVDTFTNNVVKNINHNALSNRHFIVKDNIVEDCTNDINTSLYAHNTGSILHYDLNGNSKCLSDIINELLSNSSKTYNIPTVYESVLNNIETITNPNSYTLDNSVLFANKTLLMKMKLHPWQYIDIVNGILYTYYDYGNVVTISDEYPASIDGINGSVITIKFDDNKKKGFYKILLSRKDNKYLRIGKDELVRLKLICVGNDETYGTEWDVDSYSVRNPEDISIVKK